MSKGGSQLSDWADYTKPSLFCDFVRKLVNLSLPVNINSVLLPWTAAKVLTPHGRGV